MIENHLKRSKLITLNFHLLYLFIEKIVKINCFKLSPIFLDSIPLKKKKNKKQRETDERHSSESRNKRNHHTREKENKEHEG